MMMRKIIILSFLSFAACRAHSQKGTEIREIFFRIDSVFQRNDSFLVRIDPKGLPVEKGKLVKSFIKLADPGKTHKSINENGFGWVIHSGSEVYCYIDHFDRALTVGKNDVVSMNMEVPQLPYRSIFSELAFLDIEFRDASRYPLYHLSDLWYNDSRSMEDSLMNLIISDITYTYDLVKDMDGMDALKKPLVGSRFKGRSVLDVMREVDRKALMHYFTFVKNYSASYIAQDYKANETFATWVLNNAPYIKADVYNALYPIYKDKARLQQLLPEYEYDIRKSKLVRAFAEESSVLYDQHKKDEAFALLEFTRTLAYLLNDTAGKASYHLFQSQWLHNEERFNEAILEADLAVRFAGQEGNKELELAGLMKKAYCQYRASLYDYARQTLDHSEKKLVSYRNDLPATEYKKLIQKRYEYLGWINYGEGNFDDALKNLFAAIDVYSGLNTYESKIKNAGLYSWIGSVYNDQGKPEKALEAYSNAANIYAGVNDNHNYARALNNVAYSNYNSGRYRQSLDILQTTFDKLIALNDWNNAGYSRSLMGSAYQQLGQFDSALIAHKESITWRDKAGNKRSQAWSWKKIGELYELSGLKNEALDAYDKAGEFYKNVNDLAALAEVYINAGKVHYNDESYAKAARYYEKAKGVTSKTTVEALYNLGNAWWEVDKEKALQYFLECKLKSDSTGNTIYSFYASRSLAKMYFNEHQLARGDSYYNETKELAKQLNTDFAMAMVHELRGDRYHNLSLLDSALQFYDNAASIYDTASRDNLIWLKIKISDIHVAKGAFQQAENELMQAADIARDANYNIALGAAMRSLSFLYALKCEFNKGYQANDSAMQIFSSSGNILSLASTYVNRGTIYKSQGEYKQSISAMLFADSIFIAEETPEMRGTVLNNIGVTYYNQGDYHKAMDYFNQSAAFLKPGVYNELYFLNRTNIAECLYYLGKIAEAEKVYLEVYPMAKKHELNRISSAMAIILGKINFERGDYEKADAYYKEAFDYAVASKERSKIIDAYILKGKKDVKQGRKQEALTNFASAISVSEEYGIPEGWEAYYETGLVYYNEAKFTSCIAYFSKAVDMLNKFTQNVFGDEKAKKIYNNDPRKADLYFKLAFAYSKTGQYERSFGFANLSGLAGLKELGGSQTVPGFEAESRRLDSLQKLTSALRASAEKQTGQAKIEIIKQLEIAEKEYSNYLQNLVKQDDKFNTYYPQEANPNGFVKIKKDLPDDVAVVLYLLNNNNLMVFTLTNENLTIQVDSLGKEITSTIRSFVSLAKRPVPGDKRGPLVVRAEVLDEEEEEMNMSFDDASSLLYQVLVKNIYDKIGDKKRICIIPNGLLSNLPFQALGRKDANGKFRYFIEDHALFYTNDINIFKFSNKFTPEKSDLTSFAAFGVPDDKLKFNISEVKQIGELIRSTGDIYADSRATESKAKSSLTEKKFVHFATHGVLLYAQDFSNSFLKFLPDPDSSNGNEGRLTITEVQELLLDDCDMVTLSACETAVSTKLTEGWNISPANAFLLRGTKSVVASLWKVDDEATSILMHEFYANLSKKMDKVDAIRMAQVKLSQHPKYAHPFYWGAFVLYGEWR